MSTLSKILKLSKAGDPEEEALDRLRRVLRQDPRSLQFVPLADLCRKRSLYDEAISVCLQGLSFHPTYVSGLVALARCYQESGDVAQGLRAYQRVVELSPENLVGHLGLGELAEQTGLIKEAYEHFSRAQQLGAETPELNERIQRLELALVNGADRGGANRKENSAEDVDSASAVLRISARIAALEAYSASFSGL